MPKDPTTRTIFIVVTFLVIIGGVLSIKWFYAVPGVETYIKIQDAMAQRERTFILAIRPSTPESKILDLKSFIEGQRSTQSVQYTSGAQAFNDLKEKYKDNPEFLRSLDQLGPSSYGGTLTVIVTNPVEKIPLENLIKSSSQGSIVSVIN